MSLVSQITSLVTRIAQEIKLRGLPPGGTTGQIPAKISGTSYDVHWIDPAAGGGGATTLDSLTDVATAGAATGNVLAYTAGAGWAPAAPTGGGGGTTHDIRHVTEYPYDYTGTAATGTAEATADWKVTRIALNVSPLVITTSTGAWSNRAALVYV